MPLWPATRPKSTQAVPNCQLEDDGLFLHALVPPTSYASDHSADRSKLFPDVLLAAACSLGRVVRAVDNKGGMVEEKEREERARGLVFEDAIPGVLAGKRAGMSVVWVPDENLLSVDSSHLTEKPDQVLRSPETFVPEEWGLPPFDDSLVSQETARKN